MTELCEKGHALWCERQLAHGSTQWAGLAQMWYEHTARCKQCRAWQQENNKKYYDLAMKAPIRDWDKDDGGKHG